MKNLKLIFGVLCASTLATQHPAHAEDNILLDTIVVNAETYTGTQTVPSNSEAQRVIEKTPGGVAVVWSENFKDKYSLNFEDTLSGTPGVYARKRFGEEVRISIRGSGLSRGFHLRGLSLLQDGIPFNLADGAADFQEADSLLFQRIEVFKGSNGLEHGSTTLGGAVNMVSKTGKSQPGTQIRQEAGSDSTYRTNIQTGKTFGNSDIFVSLTGTTSDGYREHDDQKNLKLNGNFGTKISDNAETRFYISGNIIKQELPGSLSLSDALNNPRSANPSSISSDWARDINSVRLANRTTFRIGDNDKIDIGAFINMKELFHPITPFVGVIDQKSLDYGLYAQGTGEYKIAGYRNTYTLGIKSHFGDVEAKVFQNIDGERGNLTADADQSSRNVTLYGENHFYVTPEVALLTGGQLTWSTRDLTDNVTPSESDSKTYSSFNPKLGVLYEPSKKVQFFANISKSNETPTFSELTQSGTTGFTPVDDQNAWTAEIGTRGSMGRFSWNVSLYRAWLEGEMLQFTTGPGIPAATFNADKTIHQGLELGLDVKLGNNLFSHGDSLKWKNAYTYSDYFFVNDAQYGDNRIPGQPRHFYRTELRYDHNDKWHVAINWEYAGEADVDFTNTLKTPSYGIVGLNAGYKVNDKLELYVDARNLADEEYISTFSTITNTAGNTSVFYPGEGRRIFGGLRMKF
ncbi:MAG: TonB-dependent receptor family protein [Methyloligellaceae bacterium]